MADNQPGPVMAANQPDPAMLGFGMEILVEWFLDLNPINTTHRYNNELLLQKRDEQGYNFVGFTCDVPGSASLDNSDSYTFDVVMMPVEFHSDGGNVISFEYLRLNCGWTKEPWDNPKDLNGTWIKCIMNDLVTMVAKHCPDGTNVGRDYYKIQLTHTPSSTAEMLGIPE